MPKYIWLNEMETKWKMDADMIQYTPPNYVILTKEHTIVKFMSCVYIYLHLNQWI